MTSYQHSLILIGMPGAGKSTLGLLLAKELAKDFVDTDLLIQHRHAQPLQQLLNQHGYLKLREFEANAILQAEFPNHVVATGGSAVYSDAAMQHLHHFGPCIFLDVSIDALRERIHNMDSRGIAAPADQSFESIYEERQALYRRYADITIDCDNKPPHVIVEEIIVAFTDGFTTKDA